MNQYQIPLSGLNCGKCIKKLEDKLSELSGTEITTISKESVSLCTVQSRKTLFNTIKSLNYQPGTKVKLVLSGPGCGKCVAKIEAAFKEEPDAVYFEVSTKHLLIEGLMTPETAIKLIEKLGYKAEIQSEILKSDENSQDQSSQYKSPKIDTTVSVNLLLDGMTCASCVSSVEKACLSIPGVTHAQINLAEQSAIVSISSDKPDIVQNLIDTIQNAGYTARISQNTPGTQNDLFEQNQKSRKKHKENAIASLIIGIPLMLWGVLGGNMMIRNVADQMTWGFVGIVCFVLLSTAGRSFYINAWNSMIHRRATMDTLVAMGTGAAWLYSVIIVLLPDAFPENARHVYFEASAMIIGLISLGHYIEAKAKIKTTHSLQALIGLQPENATLIEDGTEKVIAIKQVKRGMHLRIKPGEKIPVDGMVLSGHSYVDESMLTGEPVPTFKKAEGKVSAGTINKDGSLLIEAEGIGSETMLARIIQLVREAQSSKPAIAKLADSVSAVFVPVVFCIAVFSALMWWQFGPEPTASYMLIVFTTVLIIACPCALGLATPLSVTVGVGKAAELGVLVKDADALQAAAKIQTVVFDKTGTLTKGEPCITNITLKSNITEEELLVYAYALEAHSEHPLAKALCQYAREQGAPLAETEHFQNIRGKGVSGMVNGNLVEIGSKSYIQSQGTPVASYLMEKAMENAWTSVIVSVNKTAIGSVSIADPLKEETADAIAKLKDQGIQVVLLTGDNKQVASKIAQDAGINHVIAEVLPDEKALHIEMLQSSCRYVAMVGDGINDAPALAQADIGMAMGSGSDVAIESAQITLLNSSPLAVNSAIRLSKATVKNMKQNLFGAFVYNSIGIPVAAGVLYPTFGFLLSPVIAGAAMALSSITVVSNANRLRLFKIKK